MEEIERKTYIDVLKGIGIFYVVFGHVIHIDELRNYIWNFHMPLFFFISGLYFNNNKYPDFIIFFKSKIKSIYIPYVLFFLVTFLYWMVIERRFRGGEYSLLHQFIGLFYGAREGNHLHFNAALWFLPCLFSVELIFYFISKINNKVGITALLILCFFIGSLLFKMNLNILPFGLHTAFFAIIFYGIGFISKSQESNIVSFSLILKIILLLGFLLLQILCIKKGYFSTIDVTPIYYIPIALFGIVFYFLLSTLINKNKIFEYLGRNSLIILGFQEPIYRALIKIFSIILGLKTEIVRTNLFYCVLISIICLILIVPIIYYYNTYVRKSINTLFTGSKKELPY